MNLLSKCRTFLFILAALSSALLTVPGDSMELIEGITLCHVSQPQFEIKTGYFFFSDSKMQKIYDKNGLDIQLCVSYPLWKLSNRWTINGYGALEYFHLSGRSINGDQATSLWSIPINIGLKPIYRIEANLKYYFAIGPRYFYIHQDSHSPYVYKNKSKNGLGVFVNTGFNYTLCGHFIIDIFGEYSYAQTHFHRGKQRVYTRNIQIGGFTFGGGLGYDF